MCKTKCFICCTMHATPRCASKHVISVIMGHIAYISHMRCSYNNGTAEESIRILSEISWRGGSTETDFWWEFGSEISDLIMSYGGKTTFLRRGHAPKRDQHHRQRLLGHSVVAPYLIAMASLSAPLRRLNLNGRVCMSQLEAPLSPELHVDVLAIV